MQLRSSLAASARLCAVLATVLSFRAGVRHGVIKMPSICIRIVKFVLKDGGQDAGQAQRHPPDDECLHTHRAGRPDGGDRGAAGTAGGEVESGAGEELVTDCGYCLFPR